jgi:hypothetical protein
MTAAPSGLPVDHGRVSKKHRPSGQGPARVLGLDSDAALASLRRRLSFAGSWRYRTDMLWTRLGIECRPGVGRVMDLGAQLAFDLTESLRARERTSRPGRVHEAAFDAPVRLPQHSRYLGYWYDEARHVLIGMHLGLDINRSGGKYHVVECNTHPAMRPERRDLYADDLDPIVTGLIAMARRFGFERVVFHRARAWSQAYLDEFDRASRASGIEFVGASLPFVHETKRPIVPLPHPLQSRTIYVGNWSQGTPISLFMHDKARVGRWLEETLGRDGDPAARLASIPTSDRPVIPSQPNAPCWPNLVAKLANSDGGKFVAMGRFESEDHARDELGLGGHRQAAPRFLRRGSAGGFFSAPKVVYQPFVPPDVVGRRARLIRAHVFVSPLVDAFLSAHGVVASKDLPDELPVGLVRDRASYVVNFSTDSRYMRLEPEIESELHPVSGEFGRVASLAIKRKFEVGDPPGPARP